MKSIAKLFLLLIILTNYACSEKEELCTQDDWIGTYSLTSDRECVVDESESVTFEETVNITAGSTPSELIWNGDPISFNACNATFFVLGIELDGQKMRLTAGPCSAEYQKN